MVVLPEGTVPPVGLSDNEELRRAGLEFDPDALGRAIGVMDELYGEPTIGTDN